MMGLDVEAVAWMLSDYLRVPAAERAGLPGAEYAQAAWQMVSEKLQEMPGGEEQAQEFEKNPELRIGYLSKSLKMLIYRNPDMEHELFSLMERYNQARQDISLNVVQGDVNVVGPHGKTSQTSSIDVDITYVYKIEPNTDE
jgi:hypothetical protein